MTIPKAFISYSHDTPEHKQWVLNLATKLRASGIDAVLDLWELKPGDDLPSFMERNLVSAHKVLMICTEKYVQKANAGTGGVGYEKMIVTADLAASIESSKVVPIIRQSGTRLVPTFLRTKLFIDLSDSEQQEFGLDELIRTLHSAPLYVKPEVGGRPDFQVPMPPPITGDPLLVVMKIIISVYDNKPTMDFIDKFEIVHYAQQSGMSRLYLETILDDMRKLKLLAGEGAYFKLTELGRAYALKNKLG